MDLFTARLKKMFPLSMRDTLLTIFILLLTSVICSLLRVISDTDFHVPLIFTLAVFLVSAFTSGYAYGLVSSVIAVFGVNYIFTFPYFEFNFSMTGYPLTFICSFVVSILTCTMTTRLRQTEKLRLEAEREKMRANLLRAISHDFRTPLTSIIGSINVVIENQDTISSEQTVSLLTDAKSDAEWLINMVENLLSITKIDAGSGYEIHKEPQIVEEVVGEAITKFKRTYPNRILKVSVPAELMIIPMDAILIEQVIINLMINSVIHGEGSTYTRLTVTKAEKNALFCVEDDGAGIKKELLAGLFDGQVSHGEAGRTDDSSKNMGIGLTVCNAIIKAHGGEMSAKNLPGKGGTAVSFTLPLDHSLDDALSDAFDDADSETEEN